MIFLVSRNRDSSRSNALSGQICEVTGARERDGERGAPAVTYHNGNAAEDQVPKKVLLPVELGMGCLQLASILVNKVRVHDNADFRARQKEAGKETPYLGRQLEDFGIVEVEPLVREEAKVATDRSGKYSGRQSPVERQRQR